jgi:drug/metabolite transporter (DMT)-like permease
MSPSRKRAYIELLIVAVIWGSASPVIKYTLGGFSPAIFLTYRFFISTIIAVFFFIFFRPKFPKDKKTLLFTFLNGFLLTTVGLGLLFLGTDKTSSVDSNLITAMAPITIAIAGVLFLKEHVTKRESIGLLIALTGTFITILGPVLKGQGGFTGLEGNLLVFASIIVGTITAVLSKKVLRGGVDAATSTNLSFVIGFLTLVPFTLSQIINSRFQILTSVPFSYHLGVIYMAVLSGTLAYILWHRAEKSIEVSEVGLFAYLYPIFGVPLSFFWLKEKIDIYFIIGCIVIALGVLLAEWKKRRYN